MLKRFPSLSNERHKATVIQGFNRKPYKSVIPHRQTPEDPLFSKSAYCFVRPALNRLTRREATSQSTRPTGQKAVKEQHPYGESNLM